MENQEIVALRQQMEELQALLALQQNQSQSANTSMIGQNEYQSPPAKQTIDEHQEKESVSSETSEREVGVKRTLSEASEGSTDASTDSSSSNSKKSKDFQQTFPRVNLLHERLSPKEFLIRLETNLPRDVMDSQLKTTFSQLQTFRENFIIPLSTQVPESKQIDLNDDYTSLINMIEFKDMFRSVFIDGCNVPRIGRKKDAPVIPDTNERAAYRNFISNCWFLLGNNRKIKQH
jgi:hypothetical protein